MSKIEEIPEWAKTGPVDLKNYDYRALWHGQLKKLGDNWPMLGLGSSNFPAWHEYFARHLGGFPWCFKALLGRRIKSMNVPEARPEWFDPSFLPTPGYRVPAEHSEEFSLQHRERMSGKFEDLLAGLRQGRLTQDSGEQGKAPPGTVFTNFDEAFRRHGRARSSNEIGVPPAKKVG